MGEVELSLLRTVSRLRQAGLSLRFCVRAWQLPRLQDLHVILWESAQTAVAHLPASSRDLVLG